jgi:thymidylate synthase
MKTYDNLHDAYLGTLADVYDNPDYICSPRGQTIREKLYYGFTITNPACESIVTKDANRNRVIESYTRMECELYDSGTNAVEDFAKASKFWEKLANPDGTVNSAYGYLIKKNKSHGNPMYELGAEPSMLGAQPEAVSERLMQEAVNLMRTPWSWCVQALKADKDTRQAVLRFSLPEHFYVGNKDMTCTLDGNFHIRDNKLLFRVNMRSNDLTLGLVYDLPWFISLMHDMVDELKDTYPDLEVGAYTHMVDSLHIYDIEVGAYTHMVDSLHIYDRDEEKILKMLGRK